LLTRALRASVDPTEVAPVLSDRRAQEER
jgi:hypothetical protein